VPRLGFDRDCFERWLIRKILARREFGEVGRLEVAGDESEGRRKRRKE